MNSHLITLIFLATAALSHAQSSDWALTFGGSDTDEATSIGVTSTGSIIVSGAFDSSCDFDPGAGVTELDSDGQGNGFVASYSSAGSLEWVKHISSDYTVKLNDMVIDSNDDIVVTGYGKGYVIFEPAGVDDPINFGASNEFGAFVFKMNNSGSLQWSATFEDNIVDENNSYGYTVTVDSQDNIWCAGSFAGDIDFDPGAGEYEMSTNPGATDSYVVKLGADGGFLSAGKIRTGPNNWPRSLTVDANDNIVFCGWFGGFVDFDPASATANSINGGSESDAYICRWTSAGAFDTVYHVAGTGDIFGTGIDIASNGDYLFTGFFAGTMDADPNAGSDSLANDGCSDVFVMRLTEQGEHVWAERFGGSGCDQSTKVISTFDNGVALTGYFFDNVHFPASSWGTIYTSNGHTDVYVLKMQGSGLGVWAGRIGGTSSDQPKDLIEVNGDLMLSGFFRENVDFDPGPMTDFQSSFLGSSDAFVVQLNQPSLVGIAAQPSISFEVYPNPMEERLTIELNNVEQADYRIIDLLSKTIHTGRLSENISVIEPKIATGSYFLEVRTKNGIGVKKMIVN